MEKDNIVEFPTKGVIFSNELRKSIELRIPEGSTKTEMVNRVEETICVYLIKKIVEFSSELGKKLAKKIGDKINE